MSISKQDPPSLEELTSTWAERLDRPHYVEVATAINRANSILVSTIESALDDLDLTMPRYAVLAVLEARPDGITLSAVSRLTFIHPASLTYTFDQLEGRKLVKRKPSPTDRRALIAQITPAGRRLIIEAQQRLNSIDWGLGSMSQKEADLVSSALSKIQPLPPAR